MAPSRARTSRRLALALSLVAALAGVGAQSAAAGPLVSSAGDCADQALSRPFLPWLDVMRYTLVPGGGFEQGRSGWKLRDGAEIVAGNEPHRVRSPHDTRSLALPAGSSATSPTMCVGLLHPTLRLFTKNDGPLLSTLRVTVLFEDADGNVRRLPVGVVASGSRWSPSLPLPVIANLLPLLPGEMTPVAFKFTAGEAGGDWRVDDVYVDPMRRS